MNLVIACAMVGSALWMFFESRSFGYDKRQVAGTAAIGPVGWLVFGLLLWIVAFPLYLASRGKLREAGERTRAGIAPPPGAGATGFTRGGKIAIAVVSLPLVFIFAGAALYRPNGTPETPVASASAPQRFAAPAPIVEPIVEREDPSVVDRVDGMSKLSDVIDATREHMADTTDGPSPGALMVAIWLYKRGGWTDVEPKRDETSVGKVKKDGAAERGKRMCARGRVTQISKDPVFPGAFVGNIFTEAGNIVNFLSAMGTTGEIIEDSRARFCGIVTGNYYFQNVSGGQTQSVQMVGAFDLPENRAIE